MLTGKNKIPLGWLEKMLLTMRAFRFINELINQYF
jgi:hypothetical protein